MSKELFASWGGAPHKPAVHHRTDLKLAGESWAEGVCVGYGRDGDYLHVISFHGRHVNEATQDYAPGEAFVEKIDGDDVHAAGQRLADRAVRYYKRQSNFWSRKINYGPSGIV